MELLQPLSCAEGPVFLLSLAQSYSASWVLGLLTGNMNPSANAGEIRGTGLISGSGRPPGGKHGNPLQYSCLENAMDRGAWWAIVHGVTKSQTRLKRLSTAHKLMQKWCEVNRNPNKWNTYVLSHTRAKKVKKKWTVHKAFISHRERLWTGNH